jgi:helix-turn-helix protein
VSTTPSPLLSAKQAIKFLGLKNTGTLHVWRCHGRGPKYVTVGRVFRYRLQDLEEFIAANVRTPGQPSRRARRAA